MYGKGIDKYLIEKNVKLIIPGILGIYLHHKNVIVYSFQA